MRGFCLKAPLTETSKRESYGIYIVVILISVDQDQIFILLAKLLRRKSVPVIISAFTHI